MKNKTEVLGTIVGYTLGILGVAPLLLYWFNYVLLQHPIAYWQYVILSALLYILIEVKPFEKVYTAVTIGILICQVLNWIDLVKLPIFH